MIRRVLFSFVALLLTGCVGFPKEEARAKAKLLRDKGYFSAADRLEQEAENLPEKEIRIGGSRCDPRNDPYHFPELYMPEEKRGPKVNKSTSTMNVER